MIYKSLGRTGWEISAISFGAWAVGGTWGTVDDDESLAAMHRAVDLGVNFFDTADVYGDGRSERLIAKLRKERKEEIFVATKCGRGMSSHSKENYQKKQLQFFIERSLNNLQMESIDLLQLHCPPTEIYYMPEVFGWLDDLKREGKLRHYGVSVERVEEGLKALEYPGVQSVQIIFNMFRQRPAELFFREALKKKTGVIARVPLASGLLSGKFTSQSTFEADDHRSFNRHGEAFDIGETFSGVDYLTGLEAVNELKNICPSGMTLAQFALRWILMFEAVTCAIPGAKMREQVEDNLLTLQMPELDETVMGEVKRCYVKHLHQSVHHLW